MGDDKKIIFDSGDGPEGICVYTSEDEGAVAWAGTVPAVYIEIVVDDLLAALTKDTVVRSS